MTTPEKKPAARPKVRLFLEGRYRKLVRTLPQTIFYCPDCKGRRKGCKRCDGYGKLTRDSVQEILARKILPRYRARSGRFHGAGREDINVRMLGTGRPFVFEAVHPKNLIVDLDEMVRAINDYGRGRVEITALMPVKRARVAQLKQAPSDKVYRALIGIREATFSADDLVGREIEVVQRTPKRVAHRRADKERHRRVEVLQAELTRIQSRLCLCLEVRCEHGTYVKEWISGEEGRTRPSLSNLIGTDTDCLALDVLDVIGPFPTPDGRAAPAFAESLMWPDTDPEDPWDLQTASFSVSAAD